MTASNETLDAVDGISATAVMGAQLSEGCEVIGTYHAQHIRDGKVIWEETFPNLVTTEGKNAMLDKFLGLGTAYAAIALGLHTTVGNAASTYATPSPQVESVVYSNATRGVPAFSAASAGSKATSAAVAFTINGTATITGAFMALGASGVTTKSDTAATAILLSTGSFGASRSVLSGDTLNVSYSLAL